MEIIRKVNEYVKEHYDQDEYNWIHNEYVKCKAQELGKILGADLEILEIAARLHDIDYSRGKDYHTQDSAKKAEELLKEWEYNEEKIRQVKLAILCHTTSVVKKIENPSKEGKILHDADKMWTLTPKGFSRTIAHRYKKNTSFEFTKKCLKKQTNNFNNLFFDISKEKIKKERELCNEFLEGLLN